MTNKHAELIKRLREACNGHPNALIPWPHRLLHDAADALQAAIDAPEQPGGFADADAMDAAWKVLKPQLKTDGWTLGESFNYRGFFAWGWEARRQYTAPPAPQARELSDAEIDAIFSKYHKVMDAPWVNFRRFARMVLAARGAS